jgi:hypothetical protein
MGYIGLSRGEALSALPSAARPIIGSSIDNISGFDEVNVAKEMIALWTRELLTLRTG